MKHPIPEREALKNFFLESKRKSLRNKVKNQFTRNLHQHGLSLDHFPEVDPDNILWKLLFWHHTVSKKNPKKTQKNSYLSSDFKTRGAEKHASPTGCLFSPVTVDWSISRTKEGNLLTKLKKNMGKNLCSDFQMKNVVKTDDTTKTFGGPSVCRTQI